MYGWIVDGTEIAVWKPNQFNARHARLPTVERLGQHSDVTVTIVTLYMAHCFIMCLVSKYTAKENSVV